jgi:hypothetical protein
MRAREQGLPEADLEFSANKRDNGAKNGPGTPDQLLVKRRMEHEDSQ